jgi:hypothetical protein
MLLNVHDWLFDFMRGPGHRRRRHPRTSRPTSPTRCSTSCWPGRSPRRW